MGLRARIGGEEMTIEARTITGRKQRMDKATTRGLWMPTTQMPRWKWLETGACQASAEMSETTKRSAGTSTTTENRKDLVSMRRNRRK